MEQATLDSDVVVVIPVFNEATVLASVLADLSDHFARIICVDDGSTDESSEIARQAGTKVLRHPVNVGQGAALLTGLTWALADPSIAIIVTMDADGQHDPRDALAAVKTLRDRNLDVVLGSRFLTPTAGIPRIKRLTLKAATVFTQATTGLPFTDTHNGLRAMSRRAAERMDLVHQGMAHASEIQRWIKQQGLSWAESPTNVRYTQYSLAKGQTVWNSINIIFDLVWK